MNNRRTKRNDVTPIKELHQETTPLKVARNLLTPGSSGGEISKYSFTSTLIKEQLIIRLLQDIPIPPHIKSTKSRYLCCDKIGNFLILDNKVETKCVFKKLGIYTLSEYRMSDYQLPFFDGNAVSRLKFINSTSNTIAAMDCIDPNDGKMKKEKGFPDRIPVTKISQLTRELAIQAPLVIIQGTIEWSEFQYCGPSGDLERQLYTVKDGTGEVRMCLLGKRVIINEFTTHKMYDLMFYQWTIKTYQEQETLELKINYNSCGQEVQPKLTGKVITIVVGIISCSGCDVKTICPKCKRAPTLADENVFVCTSKDCEAIVRASSVDVQTSCTIEIEANSVTDVAFNGNYFIDTEISQKLFGKHPAFNWCSKKFRQKCIANALSQNWKVTINEDCRVIMDAENDA